LRHLASEKGVVFPIAAILLLLMTGGLAIYLYGYDAQIVSYNSLESSYVRATIKVIEEIGNINR
jgi:hypothetical protein